MTGLIVPPGEGRKLITPMQEVTFKVTAADGSSISVFEVVVPPGFDVGAHSHLHSQELFYVLEGELELFAFEPLKRTEDSWHDWESPEGQRVVRATAGACMFVPPGTPHAFRNPTDQPARMLFQSAPSPDHEKYFEEICQIFDAGGSPSRDAVQDLRDRYDVTQITPLRFEPPAPPATSSDAPPADRATAGTTTGTERVAR
ncbi:cupin domain-containing protein [Streptomyces sp. 3MP-14]|uniref:Cupin domain-containing protein n=1 Tax=Streptomyces mimosae TaxID=2586635 RepID=A0A5N5ZQU3_9ACTN|nr:MULTISPECIES: cupin domain-containing protein [Streptomyces]KAB8158884.1 cupin domain-containing protein [Streptomyces mimosae]KAB8174876.1 cupin domain-containing protein [Streptomyces sp. 3MP-14]